METPHERMPALTADEMSAAQRVAAAEMHAGRRGGVVGPFAAALRSPECMRRLQHLGEYLRYDSTLPAALREITILLTARRWAQDFEWGTHAPLARAAGVPEATLDAIAAGRRPADLDTGTAVVFDACEVFFADALYERAVAALGEPGVVDLIVTAGYYSTLAMIMNAAQTRLPEGMEKPDWAGEQVGR